MIIDSTMEPVLPVLQAIGQIPSGVFIVTVGKAGDAEASGTLVSLVQQVAIEPLYLGLAVRRGRALAAALTPGRKFVLNICHAGDKHLLRHFAKESRNGAGAFAGVAARQLDSGLTVLTEACAYIECEIVRKLEMGADHDLFIARAHDGALLGDGDLKPMVHVRHDGSKY